MRREEKDSCRLGKDGKKDASGEVKYAHGR